MLNWQCAARPKQQKDVKIMPRLPKTQSHGHLGITGIIQVTTTFAVTLRCTAGTRWRVAAIACGPVGIDPLTVHAEDDSRGETTAAQEQVMPQLLKCRRRVLDCEKADLWLHLWKTWSSYSMSNKIEGEKTALGRTIAAIDQLKGLKGLRFYKFSREKYSSSLLREQIRVLIRVQYPGCACWPAVGDATSMRRFQNQWQGARKHWDVAHIKPSAVPRWKSHWNVWFVKYGKMKDMSGMFRAYRKQLLMSHMYSKKLSVYKPLNTPIHLPLSTFFWLC